MKTLRFLALLALLAPACATWAQEPALNKSLNESVIFVAHGSGVKLETTIFKPDGAGPFPLAVINHGKEFGDPRFQARARFSVAARELVRRGYVVAIPMRGGFSKSSGGYVEGGCNVAGNAGHQAGYVRSALDWLAQQPYMDRTRMVVIGQSHGGLTAMAFAREPYPGVRGIINFAGGLKLTSHDCFDWQNSLVRALRSFGEGARVPTLWFYGENDSYFDHPLAKRMHDAYTGAGGQAKLIAYGPFKGDAHRTFSDRDGFAVWWPETEAFLTALGMPTAVLPRTVSEDPVMAALADTSRIPYVKEGCVRTYNLFLDADYPRAYAIAPDGSCGYAYGGEDPKKRALEFCQRRTKETCKLYAVDNTLVAN